MSTAVTMAASGVDLVKPVLQTIRVSTAFIVGDMFGFLHMYSKNVYYYYFGGRWSIKSAWSPLIEDFPFLKYCFLSQSPAAFVLSLSQQR